MDAHSHAAAGGGVGGYDGVDADNIVATLDEGSGLFYYHNVVTGASAWSREEVLDHSTVGMAADAGDPQLVLVEEGDDGCNN